MIENQPIHGKLKYKWFLIQVKGGLRVPIQLSHTWAQFSCVNSFYCGKCRKFGL